MIFVKCQNNFTCERKLTVGKFYRVIKMIPGEGKMDPVFYIKGDTCRKYWFSAGFFRNK